MSKPDPVKQLEQIMQVQARRVDRSIAQVRSTRAHEQDMQQASLAANRQAQETEAARQREIQALTARIAHATGTFPAAQLVQASAGFAWWRQAVEQADAQAVTAREQHAQAEAKLTEARAAYRAERARHEALSSLAAQWHRQIKSDRLARAEQE